MRQHEQVQTGEQEQGEREQRQQAHPDGRLLLSQGDEVDDDGHRKVNETSSEDELKGSGDPLGGGPLCNTADLSLSAPGPAPASQRLAATPWRRRRPASDPAGSPTAPCAGGFPSRAAVSEHLTRI